MDRLFHPPVLSRIPDSEVKVTPPAEPFSPGLLFSELQDSIWVETKAPGGTLNINSCRRAFERAHLRKMVGMVMRDSRVPEDAQTLSRQGLISLRGQLQSARNKPGVKTSL